MKKVKKIILFLFLLFCISLLFRGWIYRNLITYKSLGLKKNYDVVDENLVFYIDDHCNKLSNLDIKKIIKLSHLLTCKKLHFTAYKNETDPNQLFYTNSAHCVGYATFFSATCNYLLDKYDLSTKWSAQPHGGQLHFLGRNIHKYINTPFLKDHDFVIIENKETKDIIAVDPTLRDHLYIDFISYSK
ncbi:MAG: hypothetical protein RLZZ546_2227 [Bacteroidota bacterium]|jgi:hypothetical protein